MCIKCLIRLWPSGSGFHFLGVHHILTYQLLLSVYFGLSAFSRTSICIQFELSCSYVKRCIVCWSIRKGADGGGGGGGCSHRELSYKHVAFSRPHRLRNLDLPLSEDINLRFVIPLKIIKPYKRLQKRIEILSTSMYKRKTVQMLSTIQLYICVYSTFYVNKCFDKCLQWCHQQCSEC